MRRMIPWLLSALFVCSLGVAGVTTQPILDLTLSTVTATGTSVAARLSDRFSRETLWAADFGVKADGVTADDRAMRTAALACGAKGARLKLPAGSILLSGDGAQSIPLTGCAIEGVGVPVGTTLSGTTFLLTSTVTTPFVAGVGGALSGANFYWPNQVGGLVVYPPLISDNGAVSVSNFRFERNTVINAYTLFKGTVQWGDVHVLGNQIYAVHAAFELGNEGDFLTVSDNIFTPEPWLLLTGSSAGAQASINAGIAAGNKMFHAVTAGGGVGLKVNGHGNSAFGWRYGFFLDAGALVSFSSFEATWDGVGTIVDASSGGNWTNQNVLGGSFSSCVMAGYGISAPAPIGTNCFDMGANSKLVLDGANFADGVSGNFVVTSGSQIYLNNIFLPGVGRIADGAEYYLVKVTSGNPNVILRNSNVGGTNANTHVHGIYSPGAIPVFVVENNVFHEFNDVLNVPGNTVTGIVSGNTSYNMAGASVQLGVSSPYVYGGNLWQNPPVATLQSCGGAGAAITGALSGVITIGTTNPTTSCQFTMPIRLYGAAQNNCVFHAAGAQNIANTSVIGALQWQIDFSADAHGRVLIYNCAGLVQ